MQCGDGVGNEVNIDDIHAIFRPQRQHRQAGKKHERAHHVELRSFATPAVSEHNAGTKNCLRNRRQQLPNHVLAEFFGARIRIVIRAVPVNGFVLGNNFVLALTSHRNRADVAEAAQAMVVVGF